MKTRAGNYSQEARPDKTETTMGEHRLVVVQQEQELDLFTGRDLAEFKESLEDLWQSRPDIAEGARSRKTWKLLSPAVKRELQTQGLSSSATLDDLTKALEETYGDRRPVSQLAAEFYACRQEGYEGVISFSQRLHQTYSALAGAQRKAGAATVELAQLKERFLEGMRDPATKNLTRQYLHVKPDATFQELRREAEKMEVSVEVPNVAQVTPVTPPPEFMVTLNSSIAKMTDAFERMSTEFNKVKDLPVQMEEFARRLSALEKAQTTTSSSPRDWRQDMACFNCGEKGHLARACRKPAAGNA